MAVVVASPYQHYQATHSHLKVDCQSYQLLPYSLYDLVCIPWNKKLTPFQITLSQQQ